MDFYEIKERALKSGTTEVRPAWRVLRFKDLMIRGKSFYAVYNPETHFWSTNEYDLTRIVDADVCPSIRRGLKTNRRVRLGAVSGGLRLQDIFGLQGLDV